MSASGLGPGSGPGAGLRRDSLRFVRTVAMSVGIQGPTAGVIVGPAVLAGIVGGSGALAYLLGFVAMSFCAYAFVVFSRSFNSASSVYAFNGSVFGARYGFVSAWLLLLVYTSFAAAVYASTADIAQTLLASLGVHVGWVPIAVVGWAATMALAWASIDLSSLLVLVLEGVAILLISVVGVVVLAHGGAHHHPLSGAPFGLHGIAFSVLGLGVVNAFGAFSGFEGAAVLGEESRRPTRTIPAAVIASLVASAAVYVVFTWIVDNAYATPRALAADPAPLVHLADRYVGSVMGGLVNLAGVISAFGAQLACVNAANRLLFALGREVGGGPRRARNLLVRTDPRRGSPVGALVIVGVASLAALLAFSFEAQALRALVIIVTYGAYLIIVAYLLTVIAAAVFVWRHGRRPLPLIALGVGTIVLAYVLYDTFHPFPAPPFDGDVWAALASVAVGMLIALIPAVHRRIATSELLRAAGGGRIAGQPAPGR
ncbi:MAG TPA: APC family permease [Solirubrobacteraceae bacterium]|nr:APC family permease [Solirubrobacteraceae bacterium]